VIGALQLPCCRVPRSAPVSQWPSTSHELLQTLSDGNKGREMLMVRGSRTSLHADEDEDGEHRPDLDLCIAPLNLKLKPAPAAAPRRAAR
jgi:hypothetical protein